MFWTVRGTRGGMRSFSGILMAMESLRINIIIFVLLRPHKFEKKMFILKGIKETGIKLLIEFPFWGLSYV